MSRGRVRRSRRVEERKGGGEGVSRGRVEEREGGGGGGAAS